MPTNTAEEKATQKVGAEDKDDDNKNVSDKDAPPRQPPSSSRRSPHHDDSLHKTMATSPRLYVGNLHPRVTQVHLESLLTARSLAVQQIQFMTTANSSASFCFVTLPSVADATRAIQLLHGRKLMGHSLVVQPAHQQQPSPAMGAATKTASSSSAKKERRSLDDQIQAIRQKLQDKSGG